MTPDQACKFKMPFGKYVGKSLEQIATTDPDGARYLDWLVGQSIGMEVRAALRSFLAISWVKELVDRAIEDNTHRGTGKTEPVENLRKPKNWWEK
jgi:hypothetical protein